MHRLPGRIAAVMIGTVAILVLTVAVSVLWMSRAMDAQSVRHSTERVRTALANVLEQTRSTTLDYAKWSEAARAVAAGDLDWIGANLGDAARVGEVAEVAVVWGAGLRGDHGWTDAGVQGGEGVLPRPLLDLAEAGLRGVPAGQYRGLTYFAWHDGEVYALGAARIEDVGAATPLPDEAAGRLILGRRLDRDLVRRLGASVLLDGVEIVRARPGDRPSLPLMGGEASPVAHLAWNAQLTGTALLARMLLPLAAVTALAAALVLAATGLARRSARSLVLAERRSASAALTDGLTGLPNRAAFLAVLAAPAAADGRAVLFLDLDGFKRINDSIGHAAGDLAIVAVARRLALLCAGDGLLARLGGDEFVVVLAVPGARARVEGLAEGIARAMDEPFDVLGRRLRLSVAMGYAVQPGAATSGADLVRQADLAMYEAKRRPGGGHVAFDEMIGSSDGDARAIEAALRSALERSGELSVVYQPIVDAATGRLVRAEALARWTSPVVGCVGPDRFVAVAERAGLIGELGRQIMELVCDGLEAHPDLAVSVNVSPLELLAPGFVANLVETLAARDIAPSRIEIELTERVVVDDPGLAARRLEELHAAGFATALDDFGTGYSSIGYLDQMAFDVVKIDRSFVTGLCGSGPRLALLNAMILLCHAIGLRVVCEGVETAEELAMLRELGCDLAQGYHLDRPQPLARLIERWAPPAPRAEVA